MSQDVTPSIRDRERLVNTLPAIILFTVVLLFYLATLAPTVLWGDDAYFQRTAYTGTLRPDGGGHWLWLQLAQLFVQLPLKDVAYRVNLLSALFAALTVLAVYGSCRALRLNKIAAAAAALSLAVAHTFWTHAVRAEVYTVFTFFMAVELFLVFSWQPERQWPLFIAGLLFGLALLAHQLALLMLPTFFFFLWRRRSWLDLRGWLMLLTSFIIGLVFFYVIVQRQVGEGGLVSNLQRYFTYSGEDYSQAILDFSWNSLPRDLMFWLGLSGLQYVGLAAFLGLWGGLSVVRRQLPAWEKDPWVALFILYAISVFFAFSYHVNDQFVFYLPSYIIFAFFVGLGWDKFFSMRRRSIIPLLATLIAVPILVYYLAPRLLIKADLNPMNIRSLPGREPNTFFLWPAKNKQFGAAVYGHDALVNLPGKAVLIADHTPMQVFLYFQEVEGLRPDVRLFYSNKGPKLKLLLDKLPVGTPVFLADNNPEYYGINSIPGISLQPFGVVYRLNTLEVTGTNK